MKYIKYVMLSLIFLFCINIHLLAAINNDSIFVKQIGNPERDIILMPYSRIVKNYPVESNIALELKEKKFNYNKITDYEVESSSPNAIPDRFITLEEFSSRGETEYWFTILGLSELNKETIDSREIHYSMKPLGFSMSNSNMESIATVYENGVNPIVVSRDPKTEFLSIPNYKSIFIDKVNDMIKEISLEPKSTSWKQNILLSNDLQNIIEVTPWSIPVYFEVDDLFAGNQRYLLIKYSSTPFLYQPEYINQKIQQQFTGFAILSYDKEKTYYSMYRYSGSIYYPASVYKDTLESCTFKGQNITFMANLDTGEAILPPDSIKGFEEMLSSYQLINYSKLSSEYSDTITPPDWLPFVWGVSRENLICASVAAEQRTNLLPIVVALLGAHIVDSWWTYSVNTGDYLADVVKGRQGAKWDPFNSKNSFLTRYFYEPAAKGYIETASDFGWIDKSQIKLYTKIGGDILKFPGDIIVASVNAQQLWGSSAYLTGLSKLSTVLLGKLSYVSSMLKGAKVSNVIPKAIDVYEFFKRGYSIGQDISIAVNASISKTHTSKRITEYPIESASQSSNKRITDYPIESAVSSGIGRSGQQITDYPVDSSVSVSTQSSNTIGKQESVPQEKSWFSQNWGWVLGGTAVAVGGASYYYANQGDTQELEVSSGNGGNDPWDIRIINAYGTAKNIRRANPDDNFAFNPYYADVSITVEVSKYVSGLKAMALCVIDKNGLAEIGFNLNYTGNRIFKGSQTQTFLLKDSMAGGEIWLVIYIGDTGTIAPEDFIDGTYMDVLNDNNAKAPNRVNVTKKMTGKNQINRMVFAKPLYRFGNKRTGLDLYAYQNDIFIKGYFNQKLGGNGILSIKPYYDFALKMISGADFDLQYEIKSAKSDSKISTSLFYDIPNRRIAYSVGSFSVRLRNKLKISTSYYHYPINMDNAIIVKIEIPYEL